MGKVNYKTVTNRLQFGYNFHKGKINIGAYLGASPEPPKPRVFGKFSIIKQAVIPVFQSMTACLIS